MNDLDRALGADAWILTFSGVRFDLRDPTPESMRIEDIAHALSQLCRFGGHAKHFYSVAQHSILVSRLVPEDCALAGLLHDAAEAYLGDVVRPLKGQLPIYREMEGRLFRAIERRFGLDAGALESDRVREADHEALAIEMRQLMPVTDFPAPVRDVAIERMGPDEARAAFQARLTDLIPPYGIPPYGASAIPTT